MPLDPLDSSMAPDWGAIELVAGRAAADTLANLWNRMSLIEAQEGRDYDFTTWAPVLGGSGGTSGQTYQLQIGTAVKLGPLVFAHFYITLSAKGTITGNCRLQGLPYLVRDDATDYWHNLVIFSALATNWDTVHVGTIPNTKTAFIRGSNAPAVNNITDLTTADIGNSSVLIGLLVYVAA